MISLPSKQSKKWSSTQNSDLFGNLIRTRNLDFNKKGYLSLAKKVDTLFTETEDVDFQAPIVFANNDARYYLVTSDHCYSLTFAGQNPTATDLETGNPPDFGFDSDAVFFTADLHVSGGSEVGSWSQGGGTWTQRISTLSSSYPHPLCISEHQQYLAVGNGNAVRLYDSSYALITTCTLPVGQIVTWIRWKGNLLYFGTRNILGGEGRMYVWNGAGTAAQAGYGVGSEWCMTGEPYGDTIVVASQNGQLLKFTGNGFVPLTTNDGTEVAFPIYFSGIPWGTSAADSNLLSKIASRGMAVKGKKIFIMVDASNTSEVEHLINFPSGLWVFDPEVGLYHKAGADHKRRNTVQPTSITADVILLPSAQIFETGDAILVESANGITQLDDGRIYYAIKVDSTHLKLANTPAQALAGANMTLSGTPDTGDKLSFQVYQSVGATEINRSGPVHLINRVAIHQYHADEVLFGCEVATSAGTDVGAVMSLGMGKNVGSFITPKIQAEALTDNYKRLVSKFPPLGIASRKIIIKYRTANRFGSPGRRHTIGATESGADATWVNATSFTVNPQEYDVYTLAVGDEIEFTYGAAAGYTAHVTLITVNSATSWTITIDESMPDVTAADISNFFFDNWTKFKTITTTAELSASVKGFLKASLGKNSKWVQLKVELRGYQDVSSWSGSDSMDIEEVMLLNGTDQNYA